jgi:hypothetical protein
MIKYFYFSLLALFGALFLSSSAFALPAFPGAQGFGSDTIGGRGGRVIEVTNLNGSGSGSLRAAIEASGPRIVVFRTGGTIDITSSGDLEIENPYITIAGQTAPGDGITIKGAALRIRTHDVIVRSIRVRTGDNPNGPDPDIRDSLTVANSNTPPYNVIIDHCSMSWATDENCGTWYSVHDVTYQNCISSEGLYNSLHSNGGHSMGMLFGPGAERISVIGNLLSHNGQRNPRTEATEMIIANNVVYDRHWDAVDIDPQQSAQKISVVGNVFLKGQNTYSGNKPIWVRNTSYTDACLIYTEDNICSDPPCYETQFNYGNPWTDTDPVDWPFGLTPKPSSEVLDWVLDNAGAYPDRRDTVDIRIINNAKQRTGDIIDSQDDVGGWPTLDPGTPPQDSDHDGMPDTWETVHGLNPNNASDGNQDRNSNGYTNVEEYINSLIPMPSGDNPDDPPATYQCSDGIDNDGDGLIDSNDPGCSSSTDNNEYNEPQVTPQCSDGIDNDGDGLTDYPNDSGCSSSNDDDEYNDPPLQSNYTILKTATPPVINGECAEFKNANVIQITPGEGGNVGTYKLLWDDTALYICAEVTDTELNAAHTSRDGKLWRDDSVEVFFDTQNNKGSIQGLDDYKFFVNLHNTQRDERAQSKDWNTGFLSAVNISKTLNNNNDTDTKYIIEMKINWNDWGITPPANNTQWGFNIKLNDKDSSSTFQNDYFNTTGGSSNDPDGWGKIMFSNTLVDEDNNLPLPPVAIGIE